MLRLIGLPLFRSAYSLSCIDIFASGFIRCACACQSVDVVLICYTVAILPKQFGHFTMMFTMSEDASPCLGRCSCSHRAEAQALARHRRFQSLHGDWGRNGEQHLQHRSVTVLGRDVAVWRNYWKETTPFRKRKTNTVSPSSPRTRDLGTIPRNRITSNLAVQLNL